MRVYKTMRDDDCIDIALASNAYSQSSSNGEAHLKAAHDNLSEKLRALLSLRGYDTGDHWYKLNAIHLTNEQPTQPAALLAALFFASVDTPYEPRCRVKSSARNGLWNTDLYSASLFLCTFEYREFFETWAIDSLASEVSAPAAMARAMCMISESSFWVRSDGLSCLLDHLDHLSESEYRRLRKRAAQLLLDNNECVSARAESAFLIERRPDEVRLEENDRRLLECFRLLEQAVIPGGESRTRIEAWRKLEALNRQVAVSACTLMRCDCDNDVRHFALDRLLALEPQLFEALDEA